MKPLKSPRVIPSPSRQYWCVPLEGKGDHHFKSPYYGVGASVLEFVRLSSAGQRERLGHEGESEALTAYAQSVAMLPVAGVVIGVCWKHRGLELETVFPLAAMTPEKLLAYGNAVAEELQDADYNLLEIIDLLGQCMPELIHRQSVVTMAAERASFTEPLKVVSTSSSVN